MKDCCKIQSNLKPSETPNPAKPEFTKRQCSICGANHWRLDASIGQK